MNYSGADSLTTSIENYEKHISLGDSLYINALSLLQNEQVELHNEG